MKTLKVGFMEQKELRELIKKARKEQKEVKNSKEAAKKYLIELGLLTPKGNLKKRFKDLGVTMEWNRWQNE